MAEYELRAAAPEDNAALIALEKRSPLIVGERELSFDRAPDYFAAQRLQERWQMVVAEGGEGLVGVSASAVYRATLLGSERLLAYTHHMRVDPAYQRHGVGRALGRWLTDHWTSQGVKPERSYAFIDATNRNSLAFASSRPGPGPWPIDAWAQELPAARFDADEAEPDDLNADDEDDVLALLAATHAGLELLPPFSRDWLQARLTRTPRYSWTHWRALRRAGRLVAVAGVFDRGAIAATLLRERQGGEPQVGRSLAVLDYGFTDAAAMLALLEALRAEAGACGRQTLSINVPESSSLYERVMQEAASSIRLKFLAGEHPVAGTVLRGVYLDPVYF